MFWINPADLGGGKDSPATRRMEDQAPELSSSRPQRAKLLARVG